MEHKQPYIGLTDAQVEESRLKNGSNVLTPPEKKSAWSLFLEKFKDPIIRILLIAFLLSLAVAIYETVGLGHDATAFFEPVGIFVAVMLATVVGFLFELSANKKFDILNQVNDDLPVKVIRDGVIREISKKDVVVDDVVILELGEEVPADAVLLESVSLQINESTLTGEPVVSKTTVETDFDHEATYPTNEVLRGTTVVDGHGICRVKAVGDKTEYGKVYEGSQIENDTQTPLNRQLDGLGKLITCIGYAIAALLIVIRIILFFVQNQSPGVEDTIAYLIQTMMIAITLVVVSVPEGLPMSIVLSLALSMKRMLATNNLVRKMHACETMGAVTVICTDKTGTLTQNQMRIHKTNFWALPDQQLKPGEELSDLIREGIAVNTTAYLEVGENGKIRAIGNPTEGALLLWLQSCGEDYLALRENARIIDQLTFSTERKYMATIVQSPVLGKKILYVKGAPEIVLGESSRVITDTGVVAADAYKSAVDEQLLAYQSQAMRTLGFAYQVLDDDTPHFREGRLYNVDLTFIGIVAISDPVRADVPAAIQSCLDAGVAVKIVTGDTPGTAREIGRQIGLWLPGDGEKNITTGVEFAAMSDEELLQRLPDIKIISRARPMDKERLVRTLQRMGQVVAVTGDGTNDAPALNAAQVGLSMGDGTTVAKEASSITILDNSFHSITRAVMWGRSLYRNIQRFLLFQMTINVVACFIVFIGTFFGTQSPLTVTQMLWVNLIMDTFAAMALASLPPNERVMQDKPRKQTDFIITRPMGVRIAGIGGFFVCALLLLLYYFNHYDVTTMAQVFTLDAPQSAETLSLSSFELTAFFTVFVLFQFWNMFNAAAFHSKKIIEGSATFGGVLLGILVGQVLIVTFGGKMFGVVPLDAMEWVYILALTSSIFILGLLYRFIARLFKINF